MARPRIRYTNPVPSSFHIENFGCRAARADGEAIASALRSAGHSIEQATAAEVVIVNTCSVTAEADREARAYIRRAHRLNPGARIVATGCYAQRAAQELAVLPGVSAVVGNSHKALAPRIALEVAARGLGSDSHRRPQQEVRTSPEEGPLKIVTISALLASGSEPFVLVDDAFAHSFLDQAPVPLGGQTRPNLKIQEGCSNRCSFCVIPQTRGSSRSLSLAAVLDQVRQFVEAHGKELVLSGINLGRWGRELDRAPATNLAGLVRAIFERTTLARLRLSSIEPMDWENDLIAVVREFAGTRLARHAHLPLQSGSDSVLRRMHRRYRPWHFAEKVFGLLSAAGSGLTLGTDVLVGFPGESDREFQESYDFIRSLPFGYLHLFPFSARPGTRAWALHAENPVPEPMVRERMTLLRDLAAEKARSHRAQFIGTEIEAVTLQTPQKSADAGYTNALTENFLPVKVAGVLAQNQLIRVRVSSLAVDGSLQASRLSSPNSIRSARITEENRLPEEAF